jgi:ribosome maturation factor RimP
MARTDDGQLPAAVQDLVAPLAAELDAELLDVEVKGQRERRLVRLVADAEGGLDIDVIAKLSRRAGDALDEVDLIPGSYTLEVTSPGADRPLRRARDFARNTGRDVRVLRKEDADGPHEVTGTVVDVTDDAVTLQQDDGEVTVPLDEVDHGKVILPW